MRPSVANEITFPEMSFIKLFHSVAQCPRVANSGQYTAEDDGTMAAKWLNSVDVDFGVQFPRLNTRVVHGFVRSLKVEPQDLLGLVAVLDTRN
ncbi:hypothetical protein OUZ56_033561 [Daphnia magna]|uniref:Uncharacterized protein n=1 Tax=Daphnia magna TaxID=35525 RepID=A0ABR0BAT9_9CRUS|nr:hypothetical protein OUZ56_033561 [Daphnia magna]